MPGVHYMDGGMPVHFGVTDAPSATYGKSISTPGAADTESAKSAFSEQIPPAGLAGVLFTFGKMLTTGANPTMLNLYADTPVGEEPLALDMPVSSVNTSDRYQQNQVWVPARVPGGAMSLMVSLRTSTGFAGVPLYCSAIGFTPGYGSFPAYEFLGSFGRQPGPAGLEIDPGPSFNQYGNFVDILGAAPGRTVRWINLFPLHTSTPVGAPWGIELWHGAVTADKRIGWGRVYPAGSTNGRRLNPPWIAMPCNIPASHRLFARTHCGQTSDPGRRIQFIFNLYG